jgi:ABC-2 type transport system permease protein
MTSTIAATPATPTGASVLSASLAVARRTVEKFLRTPQLIVVGTVQSVMFLLIFRYTFGGAIDIDGVAYVDYLVPGYVAVLALFAGSATAAGMAEDLEHGFLDRLRSLPIPRTAVLTGRALADWALLSYSLAITITLGFVIGFRLHADLAHGLAALGLCMIYGLTFTWLFILLGLVAGNAQAAQGMSLMVFPFTFVSSAYVPAQSMPGWLQAFADRQPVTPMVDAVRDLCLGHPAGAAVTAALIWCVALVAVFVPLAVARFRST